SPGTATRSASWPLSLHQGLRVSLEVVGQQAHRARRLPQVAQRMRQLATAGAGGPQEPRGRRERLLQLDRCALEALHRRADVRARLAGEDVEVLDRLRQLRRAEDLVGALHEGPGV